VKPLRMLFKPGWYPYPMVRGGGSFLVLLGLGLMLGVISATSSAINTKPFIAGAILGLISIPIVRRTWWLGPPSRKQVIALAMAIGLELLLFAMLANFLHTDTAERDRWLWSLCIVGIHFIPMYWTFGPKIFALGVACVGIAVVGLMTPQLSFAVVGGIDAALKVGCGVWMFLTPAYPQPNSSLEQSRDT
jgi:hypothetical protein